MMSYHKGDAIQNFPPWKIVPLFDYDNAFRKALPKYEPTWIDELCSSALPEAWTDYLRKMERNTNLDDASFEIYEIRVAMFLIINGCYKMFLSAQFGCGAPQHRLSKRSFDVVKDRIDESQWEALLSCVKGNMLVCTTDDPLLHYANHTVPHLEEDDFTALVERLASFSKRNSRIAAVKHLHDAATARLFAILCLQSKPEYLSYRRSCVPNCTFELIQRPTGQVEARLVALYDNVIDQDIAIMTIEDSASVETRETAMQRQTGSSCGCTRCRYEASSITGNGAFQRLGHYYMSHAKLDEARAVYQLCLDRKPEQVDLHHALGAIELSRNRFLEAQRIWKQAHKRFPTESMRNEGLKLQLEKLEKYGYLERRDSVSTTDNEIPKWRVIAPQVFLAEKLLDVGACQRLIESVEAKKDWTTGRHYAVPTYDIPLHALPDFLDWFKDLFETTICPLLAQQFGVSQHFFVHDAFCVKYEAGAGSSHLPIHTDESTHSFVLALNDGYEGGGTYLYETDQTVRLSKGDLLSFKGDEVHHGGEVLTGGIRYIIAAFLYHDDDDEPTTRKRRGNDIPVGDGVRRGKKHLLSSGGFSFGFDLTTTNGKE